MPFTQEFLLVMIVSRGCPVAFLRGEPGSASELRLFQHFSWTGVIRTATPLIVKKSRERERESERDGPTLHFSSFLSPTLSGVLAFLSVHFLNHFIEV